MNVRGGHTNQARDICAHGKKVVRCHLEMQCRYNEILVSTFKKYK